MTRRWTTFFAAVLVAADQGHTGAMSTLALAYADGEGAPQNDFLAYMWFNIAASRATATERDLAVRTRDAIASRLTPDQRTEAQRHAREWDEAHPRD